MKNYRILIVLAVVSVLSVGYGVYAQVSRPYHNGSVWTISQIRVKAGMDEAYLAYLTSQWKAEQEALKKEGVSLSYMVITTEAHGPQDFNMLLLTEYKDLATLEASEDKQDSISQRVVGDDQKQMQGYRDRSEIREVLGTRIGRTIVLSPK